MNRASLRRNSISTLSAGLLMATGIVAHAQDIKERNLKFAFSLASDHPLGVGAQKFADSVAQKSGGKIKVGLFGNAVLGSDQQNLSGVRGGTIDFASMATGLLAGVDKQFMIFDFPFLFNNAQEAYAVSDGPVGTKLMNDLSLTRHVYTGMPFLKSKKTWDSMSATEHKIIVDSANEAKAEERKVSQAKELQAVDTLRKNMQVNELSPAEVIRLRQKVQPVIDKFSKEVGEPLFKQTSDELARIRGAK